MKLIDLISTNSNANVTWILMTNWDEKKQKYHSRNIFVDNNLIPDAWLNFTVIEWQTSHEGIVVAL